MPLAAQHVVEPDHLHTAPPSAAGGVVSEGPAASPSPLPQIGVDGALSAGPHAFSPSAQWLPRREGDDSLSGFPSGAIG